MGLTRHIRIFWLAGALVALIASACVPAPAGPASLPGSSGSTGTGPSGTPIDDADNQAPTVGQPAPNFRLATEDGKTIELSSLRGRVVVVNFWATWCAPCKVEMPQLQALYDDYRRTGLELIGVNMQEPAEEVVRFRRSLAIAFPTALDLDGTVARRYLIRGLPTTFLIDRAGIIREINVGIVTRQVLEEKLAKLS